MTHDDRTSGTDRGGGQCGACRLHSSGLVAHERWPLRARRDPEGSAVAFRHILICTMVGRDRVDSVRARVLLVLLDG